MFKACFDDGVNKFVIECSYFEKQDKPQGSFLLSVEEVKQQYESNVRYTGLSI